MTSGQWECTWSVDGPFERRVKRFFRSARVETFWTWRLEAPCRQTHGGVERSGWYSPDLFEFFHKSGSAPSRVEAEAVVIGLARIKMAPLNRIPVSSGVVR